MTTLLYIISNLLRVDDFSFIDVFENRKEIWFNWRGKTYKLVLSEIN